MIGLTEILFGVQYNSTLVLKGTVVHEKEKLGDFAKGWHHMKKTGPGSRDYSCKMAWMPDRKRAFFCGANHGSPTRFNDAWEYDLASNTWVMLYVPDYNDRGKITDYDKKTLVLKDGWLRTKKGGPAHPAHLWWGLTYDPILKAAVWQCGWPPYRLKAKLDCIGAKKEDIYKGSQMWLFYTQTKKWEPMKTAKPWPKVPYFSSSLEYIPELKGSLLQYLKSSWLLDTKTKSWKKFSGAVAMSGESVVCYDTYRKLLIAQRGPDKNGLNRTWHMSLKNGKPGAWDKVLETKDLPGVHDARSLMYYDPIGKVVLLFDRHTKRIWSYEPDKKKWTLLTPKGLLAPFSKEDGTIGYLDLARNVFVVIGKNSSVWCYRYKKADTKKKSSTKKSSKRNGSNKVKTSKKKPTQNTEKKKAEKLYKRALGLGRKSKQLAANFYNKIIKDYPGTSYAEKAKKKMWL